MPFTGLDAGSSVLRMSDGQLILRVAVPAPLRDAFDYLPPQGPQGYGALQPGVRVRVPFGRGTRIGILLGQAEATSVAPERLKQVMAVLDPEPVLPPDVLALARWASHYYHHPIGEVLAAALPVALRKGAKFVLRRFSRWHLTPSGRQALQDALKRAPKQAELLALLERHLQGLQAEQIRLKGWRTIMRRWEARGWVEHHTSAQLPVEPRADEALALNAAQQAAVNAVLSVEGFQTFLLDGVTGSGKTEVYLRLVAHCVERGRQALVLLPEIGLTSQIVQRFRRRLSVPVVVMHSSLSEQERLAAWWLAKTGEVPVIIGTRSAVFTPLARPGLFIVDEEHDLSFKQQEGFRYHARDLAVMRGHQVSAPVVLGSATPSLESLHNVDLGRYRRLELPERAGVAQHPEVTLLSLLGQPLQGGLAPPLIDAIMSHLKREEQVLLFLNRRGYAPVVICHECGWVAECKRCDAMLTFHKRSLRLRCHHCGAERPVDSQCRGCGSLALNALGQGTERLEQVLTERFPAARILRIDRDTVRHKGAFDALVDQVHAGEAQILLGTQMLAKGHHFPNVTLVAIVDADQGLFSADFRAPERMAQLILQVAGRAGRAEKAGRVIIQTHHPDHPLLQWLIQRGYRRFAEVALEERAQAGLPPFMSLALLRAEAVAPTAALAFLREASTAAPLDDRDGRVQLLGPMPAPMERRAGRYRAHLLVQAKKRADLHGFLDAWLPRLASLPGQRKVRWSLDVDPMEMF
jgi:primosomal protein N' (replication factor Y)